MKKVAIIWMILLAVLAGCSTVSISEPERCSLCADLPRHALCIINLSTGEKLELNLYEPHPFLVGEIAEEQPGGYFSFVRGAGIEGYKVGAEYIVISVPVKSEKMDQQFFCADCRDRLAVNVNNGYALVDLYEPSEPIVYPINISTSFSVRCYSTSVQENDEEDKYEITIVGNYSK